MPNARDTYLGASVSTADPARLLVMLLDRLVLDVTRGLEAQRRGVHDEASTQLLHAQDIVLELRTSLRLDVWDGAAGLAAIYDYLHRRLISANTSRDTAVTEECLVLATDLAATWREAAMQSAHPAPAVAAAG
ncbi:MULTISPECIES: flagellar export chaperone FliS [unclassified Nocardioides]|uniref:flagellar export chaperone FliS n=1 Tax=unclassified Nocardioides TaxID=2615069 RepID=UPI0026661640|nr:flagellar export chaperone FliS [Nocardioides sp. Arc9.136]WKN47625.1 flagellar export chaperone FliS [Nocardioides sp. Arc9.136]